MATTSQIRTWWGQYECAPGRYVKVTFPGSGRSWALSVAAESAPVWEAVAYIMSTEPYLFREAAGGTYSCRTIAGTTAKSIHAYALALDLNPSQNPHKKPLKTDMPQSFIKRMEGITANGKPAIQWGGRWSVPDAMHYQINVPPWDCYNIEFDRGDGQMGNWAKPGDKVVDLDDARSVNAYQGWGFWSEKDFDYDENDPAALDERHKVISARLIDWMMRH